MIRAWHQGSGFLCDRGPAREAVITDLVDAIPEGPWRELHDFVQVDPKGMVTQAFEVRTYSIEEELGVIVFAVVDSEFRELIVRTYWGSTYRESRDEKVVFGGLREVTDPGTQELLVRALAEDERARREQAANGRRAGEQRVAAISGSSDDPELGQDYLHAQKLLRNRVRAYGQARDTQLLQLLGRFGALPRPHPPALDLALRHFIEGCRHAAFDAGVKPTPDEKVAAMSSPPGPISDLRALLVELHKVLLQDAEFQEYVDALSTAAAFRGAAACVDRARKLLGP